MTVRRTLAVSLSLALALCMVAAVPVSAKGEVTVTAGWIELATVGDAGVQLRAKLDTGADLSSIDARGVVSFLKGSERWARFTLTSATGSVHAFAAPVIRQARIRRAGAPAETRLVVRLRICVAGQTADAEVTLSDRSGLDVPLLIGREFLAGRIVVDSAAKDVVPAACVAAKAP